jgi:hypothetical protein
MRGRSLPTLTVLLAVVLSAGLACSREDLSSISKRSLSAGSDWTAGAITEPRDEDQQGEPTPDNRNAPGSSRGPAAGPELDDIGLIPLIFPGLEPDVYSTDCEFSDDPYATCL